MKTSLRILPFLLTAMMTLLMISSGSGAQQAGSISINMGSVSGTYVNTTYPDNRVLGPILYQQAGTRVDGILSSAFSSDPGSSSQAADDFTVPAGGWSITGVYATSSVSVSAPSSVDVIFYDDEGTQPAATIACQSLANPIANIGPNGDLTIELTTPCGLTAGTYWLSLIANIDSGNPFYWDVVSQVFGPTAVWRNYGGGSDICVEWAIVKSCVGDDLLESLSFSLHGAVGRELLVNGGFEATDGVKAISGVTTRASVLDPWTIKNAVGDKIKCDTETKVVAHGGVCAFQFKGSVGESTKLQQTVDLTGLTFLAGDTLDLSAFLNANKPTTAGKIKVVVAYNDSTTPNKFKGSFGPTSGYEEQVGSVSVASSAVSKIKVMFINKSTAGKAYLDDVSLLQTSATVLSLP